MNAGKEIAAPQHRNQGVKAPFVPYWGDHLRVQMDLGLNSVVPSKVV